MLILTFPLHGLTQEQQQIVADYVWIQAREFKGRKIAFVNDSLTVQVKVKSERGPEVYNELLERINAIIEQRLGQRLLLLTPVSSPDEYQERIKEVRRLSSAASAGAATFPYNTREVVSVRMRPVSPNTLEHYEKTLTTGNDGENFQLDQNSKRLKVTMFASDRHKIQELKSRLEHAEETVPGKSSSKPGH